MLARNSKHHSNLNQKHDAVPCNANNPLKYLHIYIYLSMPTIGVLFIQKWRLLPPFQHNGGRWSLFMVKSTIWTLVCKNKVFSRLSDTAKNLHSSSTFCALPFKPSVIIVYTALLHMYKMSTATSVPLRIELPWVAFTPVGFIKLAKSTKISEKGFAQRSQECRFLTPDHLERFSSFV